MSSLVSRRRLWIGFAAFVLLVGIVACDDAPGPSPVDPQPPEVSAFDYIPETVRVAELPPDRVQEADSIARVDLRLVTRAVDPDGALARVEFSIEASQNPGTAVRGRLDSLGPDLYGAAIDLSVPSFVDETYTLRVFAVDTDSLTSNQALGQFRVIPAPTE